MRNCVLLIFYKDKEGNLRHEEQGKIFSQDKKWYYLADMTENKWFRNFSGYAISNQVLKAFRKAKIRPSIIYRVRENNMLYLTTPTMFQKKGIFGKWGNHEQWCLPLKNFKATEGDMDEPHGLPVLSIDKWLKGDNLDEIPVTNVMSKLVNSPEWEKLRVIFKK